MTPIDDILSRSLSGSHALQSLLIDNLLEAVGRGIPFDQLLLFARSQLNLIDPLLSAIIHDSLLAAWLKAAQGPAVKAVAVSRPVEPVLQQTAQKSVQSKIVRWPQIEKAVKDLASRQVLTRAEFDKLDNDAKRAAFTVSKVVKHDTISKLKDNLEEAVKTGGSQDSFNEAVLKTLSDEGEAPLTKPHMETILRTNQLMVHADAQESILNHPMVADEFPYVLYVAVHDSRVRDEHLEMEKLGIQGTAVYRRDDPIWSVFRPPWSYNCRCHLIPLSLEDAAKRGIREAIDWLAGKYPVTPAWVQWPEFRPPDGWSRRDRSPGIVAIV